MRRKQFAKTLSVFLLIVPFLITEAKADPRPILAGLIQQLQTGTPNPSWYGPQLWHTISTQTGGTGHYPALSALGPVANIDLVGSQGLPGGAIFNLVATHQFGGQSTWFMGIGALSNRIEYAYFNIGSSLPPQQIPNPTSTPTPTPPPPASPGSGSGSGDGGACSLYPNLC
jgi:hypothetical protein